MKLKSHSRSATGAERHDRIHATQDRKNRETRDSGRHLRKEESLTVKKEKKEIFSEFVCLKPLRRLDSNILPHFFFFFSKKREDK